MKRWTNGLPGATKRLGAKMAHRGLSLSQPGCARIPMMARSKCSTLEALYIVAALTFVGLGASVLQRTARAIHHGTKETCGVGLMMSVVGGRPEVTGRRSKRRV